MFPRKQFNALTACNWTECLVVISETLAIPMNILFVAYHKQDLGIRYFS